MAKLVAVCKDEEFSFERRQIPLVIEDSLTMVMEIPETVISTECVSDTDMKQFMKHYVCLSNNEVNCALMIKQKDLFSLLAISVPCVGCRRSVERLYNQLWESGQHVLEPLVITASGVLTLSEGFLVDAKLIYALFYIHGSHLNDMVDTIPKSKRNRRCMLHSLDNHKARALSGSWMDVWDLLSQECRDEVVLIDSDGLLDTLEHYLRKHRFCSECKSKVLKAYSILSGDVDGDTEKSYCAALYEGLKSCPEERHIHVVCDTDFIAHLIGRAEPELAGGRCERHARTIDIAQEEVLTCLGIYLWERLHRLWQKLRAEEQTWQMLFYLGVEGLRKSYETAVEEKQGISQLELVVEEISEAERVKEMRKENKRLKRKKRKENKKAEQEEKEVLKKIASSNEEKESVEDDKEEQAESNNESDKGSTDSHLSARKSEEEDDDSSSLCSEKSPRPCIVNDSLSQSEEADDEGFKTVCRSSNNSCNAEEKQASSCPSRKKEKQFFSEEGSYSSCKFSSKCKTTAQSSGDTKVNGTSCKVGMRASPKENSLPSHPSNRKCPADGNMKKSECSHGDHPENVCNSKQSPKDISTSTCNSNHGTKVEKKNGECHYQKPYQNQKKSLHGCSDCNVPNVGPRLQNRTRGWNIGKCQNDVYDKRCNLNGISTGRGRGKKKGVNLVGGQDSCSDCHSSQLPQHGKSDQIHSFANTHDSKVQSDFDSMAIENDEELMLLQSMGWKGEDSLHITQDEIQEFKTLDLQKKRQELRDKLRDQFYKMSFNPAVMVNGSGKSS